MSSSFAFLPRAISTHRKNLIQNAHPPRCVLPTVTQDSDAFTTDVNGRDKTKATVSGETSGKTKYSDEDYANVICMAISDYALWLDPDLRRTVDWSIESESGKDGFIPLRHLLNSSKVLIPLQIQDSQTLIVKALRSCASDVIDVRLLVSEPSSSTWFGSGSKYTGGYEIRRKDWADNASRPLQELSKKDWEERTIYLENIPSQYRTIPGIARFILSLLWLNASPAPMQIQGITLPLHHQDKPGDHPTCKGFALVVLSNPNDLEFLLHRWPWDRTIEVAQTQADTVPDAVEASKFGFRTLPKVRWDELREEYLAYRKQLVEEINAFDDAETLERISSTSSETQKLPQTTSSRDVPPVDVPTIEPSLPYPASSLVFARNLHPETNKTTLRKLFTAAFVASLANGAVQSDGVDYVDFNKGMDSCYIRLATPKHAKLLLEHFSVNCVCQSSGLDDTGCPSDAKNKAIAMELVVGKREEFYWEKVPEKIRRQAVEKAISLMHPSTTVNVANEDAGENSDKRKRKRRKH